MPAPAIKSSPATQILIGSGLVYKSRPTAQSLVYRYPGLSPTSSTQVGAPPSGKNTSSHC